MNCICGYYDKESIISRLTDDDWFLNNPEFQELVTSKYSLGMFRSPNGDLPRIKKYFKEEANKEFDKYGKFMEFHIRGKNEYHKVHMYPKCGTIRGSLGKACLLEPSVIRKFVENPMPVASYTSEYTQEPYTQEPLPSLSTENQTETLHPTKQGKWKASVHKVSLIKKSDVINAKRYLVEGNQSFLGTDKNGELCHSKQLSHIPTPPPSRTVIDGATFPISKTPPLF